MERDFFLPIGLFFIFCRLSWCIIKQIWLMIIIRRHECAMWSWNPFHTFCCQRRRLVWTCYIDAFCMSLLLHWNSLAALLGQSTWSWDVPGYWPGRLWYYWPNMHICKSFCQVHEFIIVFYLVEEGAVEARKQLSRVVFYHPSWKSWKSKDNQLFIIRERFGSILNCIIN